jgi:transcriptional regulator with XRE-family HTH domain
MSELGLTQEALAVQAGVDPTTVNAFLNGRNWPQPRTRAKLEIALKWEVGTLLKIAKGEEPPRSLRDLGVEELRRLIHEAEDELAFLNPRYESTRRVITARLEREIAELRRQLDALESND